MGYLGSNASFTGTQNNKRVSVIATQGQTLFTVSGGYAINAIDVYRNGVKLSGQRDFTALDGASVTLVSAANADDILEFVTFENFQREDVVTGDGDSVIKGNLQVNGDLGVVGGTLNATVSNTETAGFAQTAGISTQVSGFLGVGVTGTNLNVTGVITATQFDGNITGTAATFTGNVTVGGTLTYDDVTNIDSVALITARNGLQVLAGITTISGQTNLTNTNVTAGIVTVAGQTNLTNTNVTAGIVTVAGQTNLANVNVSAAGTVATLTVSGQSTLANVSVSAASTFSGKINANAGVGFTGFLREGINIVSGKLSDNTTINIDHSMAHYFTTTETTTGIPNFTSTAGINTDLSVGETFSVNVITTAATAGYSTGAKIDAGSTLSVLWNGGSDPSTGGDGGVDVYTYQVIKTGDAAFTVLGNVSNFA